MKVKEKAKKIKKWVNEHDDVIFAGCVLVLDIVIAETYYHVGYTIGKKSGVYDGMNRMLKQLKGGLAEAVDTGVLVDESVKNFENSSAYAENFIDNCFVCGIYKELEDK